MKGFVYRINIKPETPEGRGLPKQSAEQVFVYRGGVEGDFNRYRHEKNNDSPDMALLIMPLETLRKLNSEGWPVAPGDLGENITSLGIPYDSYEPGKIYRVGESEVQISEPCTACENLKVLHYIGEEKKADFIKTLTWKEGEAIINRRGWYARVLKDGAIKKGIK